MTARRRRLARTDFPTVLKYGKRLNSEHFSLVYTDKVSGSAVVVSKKVAKTAVARHRVKRRGRALLRETNLPYGCVLFARPGAAALQYEDLAQEVGTLLKRTNEHNTA